MPSSNRPKRDADKHDHDDDSVDDDSVDDTGTTDDLPLPRPTRKALAENDRSRAVTNRMERMDVEQAREGRTTDGQRVRSLRGSTVVPPRTPKPADDEEPDEASARLINAARAGGGRVVAVGTTAVRAVESAAGDDGVVRAARGWTELVVTPERGVRVVDGLFTGLHEPEASHLLMLEGIAGRAAVSRTYEEALRGLYLWHEFGDVHLILPEEKPHPVRCDSNFA